MHWNFLRILWVQGQGKLGMVNTRLNAGLASTFSSWRQGVEGEVQCAPLASLPSCGIRSSLYPEIQAACGKQLAGGFCAKLWSWFTRARPENG